MANTFEQTVAALVENRISAEHPNLSEHRRGFVLLDFNEKNQTALGMYRFMIGTVPALMPAVYRAGELDGLSILILRDLPLFVPAIDSWISFAESSGNQDLGELLPDKGKGKGPSGVTMDLKSFPHLMRTASARLTKEEFTALSRALSDPLVSVDTGPALQEGPLPLFTLLSKRSAALVSRASASDPVLEDTLIRKHGAEYLAGLRRIEHELCPAAPSLLRKASSGRRAPELEVITDIGSPQASSLKPAEKRTLLKRGQFVIDHRAEAATTVVMRSPEGGIFQTCPGAGSWRALTADGELVEVDTYLPGPCDSSEPTHPGSFEGSDIWVVPLDGSGPFEMKKSRLYVRGTETALSDRPEAGKPASREAVLSFLERSGDSVLYGDGHPWRSGRVLILKKGRAHEIHISIPPEFTQDSALEAGDRTLVFTGKPGNLRVLEDRYMIPSDARVVSLKNMKKPFTPGRPEDLTRVVMEETGVKELSVKLADGLIDMDGAVNRKARSENQAVLDLAIEGGIHAATAVSMVRDATVRPGKAMLYLVRKSGFEDDENTALAGLSFSTPEHTEQTISPDILREQGGKVAGSVRGEGGSGIDEAMIRQILSLSDFREITADMVRRFSAAMDEAGKMLFRLLVHRERYEEMFGEDVDRMESALRDGFMKIGDLALYMREKKSGGIEDGEDALAGLLTDDMS